MSTYQYYLDSVLNTYNGAPALASLWFIWFDLGSLSKVAGAAQGILSSKESGTSWKSGGESLSDSLQSGSDGIWTGCTFARSVTVPPEAIGVVGSRGLEFGGYHGPLTLEGRSPQGGLSITFMDCQSSFVDHVLRPWMVSGGYKGLIADGNQPFCETVRVNYLARTGSFSPLKIRKTFCFYKVLPVRLSGFSNSQNEEGLMQTSCDFAYERYDVQ